jgi:geranylgeranyl pyrophosphate synthase
MSTTPISAAVQERLADLKSQVEARLEGALAPVADAPEHLREAMRYALMGGGKRLRPGLCLTAGRLVGGDDEAIWPGALALEMLHTYSLVHDDLPAMDDDELRRGRPTVHVAFDEATAILAGDALLTLAFETIALGPAPAERGIRASAILGRAAGAVGMVGGQVLDLDGEKGAPTIDHVRRIHAAKTGALLTASVEMGAVLGGANEAQQDALRRYGAAMGLAFQIVDDCLDETASSAELGKTAGKDKGQGKQTWPACVGLEASMDEARRLIAQAREALEGLEGLDQETRMLQDLALYIVERRA